MDTATHPGNASLKKAMTMLARSDFERGELRGEADLEKWIKQVTWVMPHTDLIVGRSAYREAYRLCVENKDQKMTVEDFLRELAKIIARCENVRPILDPCNMIPDRIKGAMTGCILDKSLVAARRTVDLVFMKGVETSKRKAQMRDDTHARLARLEREVEIWGWPVEGV